MSKIRLTNETLKFISTFEGLTRVEVKDCVVVEDRVIFVVDDLKGALGKGGANIRRLKEILGRNVDVIGFSPSPERFVKNIFHNYKVKNVTIEDRENGRWAIVEIDPADKGRAIGKNRRNLKVAEEILGHHFPIKTIYIN